jgi:hypothetical protein
MGSKRELVFLKCNSETGVWGQFKQIDNRPTWMAIRLTKSFLTQINSGELIVFDENQIQHSRQLTLRMDPALWYSDNFWQRLNYDPEAVSITYNSSDGLHRYEILTEIDRKADQ